jgi:hypothetical protein
MTNTFLWNRWAARLGLATLVLTLALAPLGCRRKTKVRVETTEEEAPRLASTVSMADPLSQPQLISGFQSIEENSWRWTARQFIILLRPPIGAADKGAVLKMQLTVPDALIAKLQTVSLSASIDGRALPAETYTKPGRYTYQRDVDASLLSGESTKVEFQLDKAMPPGTGGDVRELGIVARSIGLEPK